MRGSGHLAVSADDPFEDLPGLVLDESNPDFGKGPEFPADAFEPGDFFLLREAGEEVSPRLALEKGRIPDLERYLHDDVSSIPVDIITDNFLAIWITGRLTTPFKV
jgi:hypothetical protein